ncbi:hypothetical protein FJ981_00325 [Mesorhizobium sp. B1-1-4]|uniref:hypothetical protein n=1 Tax=Mesorhizobium sp. B1-1-4 TaxID=2589980 RepID=UPI00112B1F9D|nr:hypothetical protein [Mesorhizobium sp. B1-1-4]TPN60017.1 hypothetical protein FJ981_00325 [Mesorhizobium sp. B1-1-4]
MAGIMYNNIPFDENDLSNPDTNFALGQFMTAWSQVESLCGFLFRNLSQIGYEIGNIIFDRVGAREQIEILTELIHLMPNAEQRESASKAMKEVESLSRARNKIVHAGWGLFNGEPARFWHGITNAHFDGIATDTAQGKADRERFIFTLPDIATLTGRSVSVRQTLESILQELKEKQRREQLLQHARRLPNGDEWLRRQGIDPTQQ